MTDLWTEATRDAEAEEMSRQVTAARVSAVDVWPFLAGAEDERDYVNRKAIVAERLDQIVSTLLPNDPVGFGVVRSSLEASFDEDYQVVAAQRAEERQARQRIEATLAAQREEQEARARVEATLQQREAATASPEEGTITDPKPRWQSGSHDVQKAKCKNCGAGISKGVGNTRGWVHQSGSKHCLEAWQKGGSKTAATEGPWKAQVAGNGEGVWSENALRFQTEEEARAYIADLSMRWFGFDLGRVVPADTPNREPVDLSDPRITHNFRTGSKRTADFHEMYGEVSRAQLAAYRKHNVSPSDHDMLVDMVGDDPATIVKAVKAFSPNGMFSWLDLSNALRDYDGDLDAALKDEYGYREGSRRSAAKSTAAFPEQQQQTQPAQEEKAAPKAVERRVDQDPDTGEFVGSEWVEKEGDPNTLVQSDTTFNKNPRFQTQEEANGWQAETSSEEQPEEAEESADKGEDEADTTKPDAGKPSGTNPFEKKDAAKTAYTDDPDSPDYNDFDINSWREHNFGGPESSREVDGVTVHTFASSAKAYNESQVNDSIKDGDVLWVPSEGVAGVLNAAWPLAVTEATGEFHGLKPGHSFADIEGGKYAHAAEVARQVAGGHTASRGRHPFAERTASASWVPAARAVLEGGFKSVDPETNEVVETKWRGDEVSPRGKGVILDATTANMLLTVHDALTGERQERFANMPLVQAVEVGWKLVSKTSAKTASADWDIFRIEVDDEGMEGYVITDPVTGEDVWLSDEGAGMLLDALNGHAPPTELSMRLDDAYPDHLGSRRTASDIKPGDKVRATVGNGELGAAGGEDLQDADLVVTEVEPDGTVWVHNPSNAHGNENSLAPGQYKKVAAKTAETHAPYRIQQDGGKWKVVNDIGETKGTHDTKEQAREQQKALYANVEGASEQAEKKSSSRTASGDLKVGDKVWFKRGWMQAAFDGVVAAVTPSGYEVHGIPNGGRISITREALERGDWTLRPRTAANPYSVAGNPYVAPMQTPGTPDDILDGPADINPPVLDMPMTTRPRKRPNAGQAIDADAPVEPENNNVTQPRRNDT